MTANPVFNEMIDLLATLPAQTLLDFHPSQKMQKHVDQLLQKNRDNGLSDDEKSDLDKIMVLEHIVRMAKARVLKKMRG